MQPSGLCHFLKFIFTQTKKNYFCLVFTKKKSCSFTFDGHFVMFYYFFGQGYLQIQDWQTVLEGLRLRTGNLMLKLGKMYLKVMVGKWYLKVLSFKILQVQKLLMVMTPKNMSFPYCYVELEALAVWGWRLNLDLSTTCVRY